MKPEHARREEGYYPHEKFFRCVNESSERLHKLVYAVSFAGQAMNVVASLESDLENDMAAHTIR